MFSKLTRNGKIYAFFPFLIPEDNPHDRVVVDKDKIFDPSKQTGWDRVKALFSKHQDTTFHPKLVSVVHTSIASFVIGGIIGGIKSSRTTFIQFIENNEATKFESQFHAKRLLSDKMFTSFGSGGLKLGIRVSFFCTSLMLSYVLISTYKNKDAIWYYSAGGAYAGAIYKFPLGPKGMISGGVFGGFFGTLYGAFHYLSLLALKWSEEQYQQSIYQKKVEREETINQVQKRLLMKQVREDFEQQMLRK
ncbi:upstream of RpII140 [Nasonia vitripennis]|uniref:Complex I assembly factor TIMMDC1, mitochondrial n=1 Tax=Nasonia vitripennis TaxID=7425 RepID=A0A7M6UCG4_NASVI|nr:upstream of RpII140 [Nasonia vitripennis]